MVLDGKRNDKFSLWDIHKRMRSLLDRWRKRHYVMIRYVRKVCRTETRRGYRQGKQAKKKKDPIRRFPKPPA